MKLKSKLNFGIEIRIENVQKSALLGTARIIRNALSCYVHRIGYCCETFDICETFHIFIILNTMMENEITSFANISIPLLGSCSQHCGHDPRRGIEILAKLVFSFSIIVFNMVKLLVILFIMKLIAQINIYDNNSNN